MSQFDMLVGGIRMAVGRAGVESQTVLRLPGIPPLCTQHLRLDGKEYALALFPLDNPPESHETLGTMVPGGETPLIDPDKPPKRAAHRPRKVLTRKR